MKKGWSILAITALFNFGTAVSIFGAPPGEELDSLTGNWYGYWDYYVEDYGSVFELILDAENGYAVVHVPEVGLIHQPLPALFMGSDLVISIPDPTAPYTFYGTFDGESISGWIYYDVYVVGAWHVYPEMEDALEPGPAPGPDCADLPDLFVLGEPDYVTELLPFDPDYGVGYIDYPMNGETWENQYRSYARRDLIQLVKYATAKVACKTADWDYWPFSPLGLVDMSEADGSIPGSSIGYPGHPTGTHENGNDMDLAYFQIFAPDNKARVIGYHHDGYEEAWHLTSAPFCLDPFRTALLIAYLAEHPHLRVIGVDGQAGLAIEDALDILVSMGWIDADLRNSIPLAYEVEDQGYGWFLFHHHHLHVSMHQVFDATTWVDIQPNTLNRKGRGKYITAYLELVEEIDLKDVDLGSLMLIVNGHTTVPVVPDKISITDYNENGVPDLTLKFDRQMVSEAIDYGMVEVAISGSVYGVIFQGTDIIHVR